MYTKKHVQFIFKNVLWHNSMLKSWNNRVLVWCVLHCFFLLLNCIIKFIFTSGTLISYWRRYKLWLHFHTFGVFLWFKAITVEINIFYQVLTALRQNRCLLLNNYNSNRSVLIALNRHTKTIVRVMFSHSMSWTTSVFRVWCCLKQ